MGRKRKSTYTFSSKKEKATVSADPKMLGVCGMMAVCVLHTDIERTGEPEEEHALRYLRDYLRKYKKTQEEVRTGLAASQRYFVANRAELNRRPPTDQVRQVRAVIEETMEEVWHGKKRKRKEKAKEQDETQPTKEENTEAEAPSEEKRDGGGAETETKTEIEATAKEVNWAAMFAAQDEEAVAEE